MKKGKKILGMLLTAALLVNVPIMQVSANTVGDNLKVATYNIAAGKKPNIEAMNTALENEEIDVVGVQEVDMNNSRNDYDMLQKFVDYGYFSDYHFQKAISFGGGDYGIGILSKYELKDKTGASIVNEGNYEARAYARGVIEKDGKEIAIYSTHLTHENQSLRAKQMQEVLDVMDADPTPYKILTGDFNTDQSITENYPMMKNYNLANGKDGIWHDTYAGEDPTMKVYCIDNVVTSRNIKVNEVKMVETGLSDHNMLYIDCQLLDKEEPSKQLLDYVLADAKNIKESEYTKDSYQALKEAIDIAEKLALDSTQNEIDQVINLLQTKLDELEKIKSLDNTLIPKPLEVNAGEGKFVLNNETTINVKGRNTEETAELAKTAEYIANKFKVSTGYQLSIVKDSDTINNSIVLKTIDNDNQGDEGYTVRTVESGVEINANKPAGIFMGVQTLRQLLPAEIEKQELVEDVEWTIPCSTINDKPEYGYRGAMLDVSRHFFTVDEVKRYIDNMAQYKMNKLHMHLSDDQGWRLEIKGSMYGEDLSKLNTIGAQTSTSINGIKAGQYTQEEFKEIVAYAADRYIEIIPEFDMPGHSWAALVSLNFLNSTEDGKPHSGNYDNTKPYEGIDVGFSTFECRNEKTYEFIDEVFRQVAEISPSKYIHIGGDEARSTSAEDYKYFVNRVTEIAQKYGKTPIGWQEYDNVVEDKEGTVTQFWDTGNAKMKEGIKYVMSPADHAYMDMKYDSDSEFGLTWATMNPIDDSYNWDPTNYGDKENVVGIEAALWSETLSSNYALDYMTYPRLLGHAEIGWTPKELRSWEEYKPRLIAHGERLENQGIDFYKDEDIWEVPYEEVNATWKLDEGQGTTINDTNNQYPGSLQGDASWIDGVNGKAISLNGAGYVDLNIQDLKNNWTIGMWVNRQNATGNNAALISGDEGEIKLEQYENTKKVGVTKFGETDASFNYEAPVGSWVHLTFVSNDDGITLYVNGEYQDHLDITIKGPVKRIGANAKAGLADSGNMKGAIDEVSVFNRELTADEVKDLAKSPEDSARDKLQTLYDECKALDEANYTAASWKDFKNVMEDAKTVLDNADATLEEINNMFNALQNAKDQLVALSKIINDSEVGTGIDQFNFVGEWGVSTGYPDRFYNGDEHWFNWARYEEGDIVPYVTITFEGTGIELYGNKDTMMGIYDITVDDGEVQHVDAYSSTTMYQQLLFSVTGLEYGEHTIKLTATRNKNENSSSSDVEIDYAKILYTESPIQETDKTALKIAIDKANEITDKDLENVVPVVVEEFKAARDEANAVYNNENATQEQVNNAFDRLANAMQKLEFFKGDKKALEAFVNKVTGLNKDSYTKATWEAFEAALNNANDVLANENALETEVNEAYDTLVRAFLDLRLIPNKDLLNDLINKAESLEATNYSVDSFKAMQEALANAKAVAANENATQAEVDNAKDGLAKAIANLQANTPATDNSVNTPVKGGNATSVKTGDNNLISLFAGLSLLSLAGLTLLRKKD